MTEEIGQGAKVFPKVSYRALESDGSDRIPTDELGRSAFAENLVKLILSKNMEPPYIFAIYGRWGAGKTWVARHMEMQLGWEQNNFPTCWFEAWRYESEDNLLWPLCNTIRQKFNIDVLKVDPKSKSQFEWMLRRGKSRLEEILPSIFGGLLRFVAHVGARWALGAAAITFVGMEICVPGSLMRRIAIDGGLLMAIGGLFFLSRSLHEGLLDGWSDPLLSARNFFEKFISAAVGANRGKTPLFVFVEDLDRCAPDSAIRLLESIKRIALNSARKTPVVFVLVLDREAMVAAIQHRYGKGYSASYAEDYLQKLVRYSVELPEPSHQRLLQLFLKRNEELHFNFDQEHIGRLSEACISGRLHNLRKLESVFQKFHLIDAIYAAPNPRYKEFRFRVLFYLLLKEFHPEIHQRIMAFNNLLPKFFSAASKGVQNWYLEFKADALTAEDANNRDLAGFIHRISTIEKVEDEAQANRILRYALMIEEVGAQA